MEWCAKEPGDGGANQWWSKLLKNALKMLISKRLGMLRLWLPILLFSDLKHTFLRSSPPRQSQWDTRIHTWNHIENNISISFCDIHFDASMLICHWFGPACHSKSSNPMRIHFSTKLSCVIKTQALWISERLICDNKCKLFNYISEHFRILYMLGLGANGSNGMKRSQIQFDCLPIQSV